MDIVVGKTHLQFKVQQLLPVSKGSWTRSFFLKIGLVPVFQHYLYVTHENTCPRTLAFGSDHLLVYTSLWGSMQQIGLFSLYLLHIIHSSIKALALTALHWFSVAKQSCWALLL